MGGKSEMKTLLVGVFCILGAFVSKSHAACPHGYIDMLDGVPGEEECVELFETKAYYWEAIRQCRQIVGGDMAKIVNSFENRLLYMLQQQVMPNSSIFIGVEQNEEGRWVYTDGSPLGYNNWQSGQPSSGNYCVEMDPKRNGQWKTTDCREAKPYFCTAPAFVAPPCPEGWSRGISTASEAEWCYYLKNFTWIGGQLQMINQATAEAACASMFPGEAHLVSIHSKAENDYIEELIKSNVGTSNCSTEWVFIGLQGNRLTHECKWTDGTSCDYDEMPRVTLPDAYVGVLGNDESCETETWASVIPSTTYPRYVCKMKSEGARAKMILQKILSP